MKTPIEQRVLTVTDYMVSHNATVRATAEWYGVGKSTIHMVVTKWNGLCGKSREKKHNILYMGLDDR